MINNKTFDHRPIGELMAIVKNDFSKFDNEGLIDEGRLIKTVMACNHRLGIGIREIREIAIVVNEFQAELPLDFEKLYYAAALEVSNSMVTSMRNPWDNSFDQDIIYEANLDRASLGCVDNYTVNVKRETQTTVHQHGSWIELNVDKSTANDFCHIDSPNKKGRGRYTIEIKDGKLETPFRTGTIYIMYIGTMMDHEGNITFPFHPIITPYYEWSLKEKILTDAVFNSDMANLGPLLEKAERERVKAWMDAFNFTTQRSYGEYVDAKKKRELGWYHEHFKYLQ